MITKFYASKDENNLLFITFSEPVKEVPNENLSTYLNFEILYYEENNIVYSMELN